MTEAAAVMAPVAPAPSDALQNGPAAPAPTQVTATTAPTHADSIPAPSTALDLPPPPALPNMPSPTKRPASPEPEDPAPKRIKMEPVEEPSIKPEPPATATNPMATAAAATPPVISAPAALHTLAAPLAQTVAPAPAPAPPAAPLVLPAAPPAASPTAPHTASPAVPTAPVSAPTAPAAAPTAPPATPLVLPAVPPPATTPPVAPATAPPPVPAMASPAAPSTAPPPPAAPPALPAAPPTGPIAPASTNPNPAMTPVIPETLLPMPIPQAASVAATPVNAATPIPSIEKSPSVKPEPVKDTATPEPVMGIATPEVQSQATPTPTPTATAAAATPTATTSTRPPPKKRRRMLEPPGQTLKGMNMQLLGINSIQVLEWLAQEPFEDTIDALRDEESELFAMYTIKVTQFEQAWRNFSTSGDLLVWSSLGIDDQKHRKTVRLANLTRFGIDLFSEDETCLPSLHDRFFRVFVYGTRRFTMEHSNLLLELKTQLAIARLAEGVPEGSSVSDMLQKIFLDGLEDALKERSWNKESFDDETAMLTSAEIRMALLQQEYEESGSNADSLGDKYPPDSLLKQLGSYIHSERVAHEDHCKNTIFSSQGKQKAVKRSEAYQDDDDYWQKTNNMIDEVLKSVLADMSEPKPTLEVKDAAGDAAGTTEVRPAATTDAQSLTAAAPSLPQNTTTTETNSVPLQPMDASVLNGLGYGLEAVAQFINQKVSAREAEIARASHPPTPHLNLANHDTTAQNLYLLSRASQMPQTPQPMLYAQPGSTAQAPPVPIPPHHMPHAMAHVQNHMSRPSPGQASDQPPLAPGELPPNQTCATSVLYDKARQAALSKSTAHTRREGIHSTRRPWTPEEEKALMTGLDMVKGPHWSQILSLFGPNGTISDVLKDRTQVQLKDKARNLKLFFLKTQSEMPYYLSAVTGELKTRAPNQAARKEAEERARLSREEDQAKVQGIMALAGGLQNPVTPAQGADQGQGHGQGQGQNLAPPPAQGIVKQQPVQGHQHHQQQHQHHQHQHQHQHQQLGNVVTPAQAALAAQITTPAMAQGQAQSAAQQRPLQAAVASGVPASGAQSVPVPASTSTSASPAPAPAGSAAASTQGVQTPIQARAHVQAHSQTHSQTHTQPQTQAQAQAQTHTHTQPRLPTPASQAQTQPQPQSQARPSETGATGLAGLAGLQALARSSASPAPLASPASAPSSASPAPQRPVAAQPQHQAQQGQTQAKPVQQAQARPQTQGLHQIQNRPPAQAQSHVPQTQTQSMHQHPPQPRPQIPPQLHMKAPLHAHAHGGHGHTLAHAHTANHSAAGHHTPVSSVSSAGLAALAAARASAAPAKTSTPSPAPAPAPASGTGPAAPTRSLPPSTLPQTQSKYTTSNPLAALSHLQTATANASRVSSGTPPTASTSTVSSSFPQSSFPPSGIPANLFSRVTEAEATNAALLERLRAEVAREAKSSSGA